MKKICTSFAMVFCFIAGICANEPLWTDKQRLEKRDVVVIGKIISTEKVSKIDDNTNLFMAKLQVEGMKKGKKTSVGTIFRVYYEFSSTGQKKCPKQAKLEKGDSGTFYLRAMNDAIKKHIGLKIEKITYHDVYLEMESDIKRKNSEQKDAPNSDSAAAKSE